MPKNQSEIYHKISQLEWLIQTDLGHRGIHHVPGKNLCTFCQGNLYRAIKFLAEHIGCKTGVITGFYIPTAHPPAPENDGPPGALFISRGLSRLGYPVQLITDSNCLLPLQQGIDFFSNKIELVEFPFENEAANRFVHYFFHAQRDVECLISIERVGPCHTTNSFLNQHPKPSEAEFEQFKIKGPKKLSGEFLNMRANSVTNFAAPFHLLFDKTKHRHPVFTIGIGDGGNEIGMGTIPWKIISENIQNGLGGKIACSIPTDATIVAGVSNWVGYALIAGLHLYLGRVEELEKLFIESLETELMKIYFRSKSTVDGKLGIPAMSVDGIDWQIHLTMMQLMKEIIRMN